MKKILQRDIIIPAGSEFFDAPVKTERTPGGMIEHVFGLSKNTSGQVTYELSDEVSQWFSDSKVATEIPPTEQTIAMPSQPTWEWFTAVLIKAKVCHPDDADEIPVALVSVVQRYYEAMVEVTLASRTP